MTRKTRRIGLIAALSIGLMGAAHAQDSAIIEAIATINDSAIPLAVSGERSLSFGAVGKPIAELNGSFCTYSIGVAAADYLTTYYETELPNGDYVSVTPGSPVLGCDGPAFEGLNLGKFTVACTPGTTVGLDLTYERSSAVGTTLSFFPAAHDSTMIVTESGQAEALASAGSTGSAFATCQGGALDVWVGGTLTVRADAAAGSDVSVGTITLNVSY